MRWRIRRKRLPVKWLSASWSTKYRACRKTGSHGIRHSRHDDGDRARCSLCGLSRQHALDDDDVDLHPRENVARGQRQAWRDAMSPLVERPTKGGNRSARTKKDRVGAYRSLWSLETPATRSSRSRISQYPIPIPRVTAARPSRCPGPTSCRSRMMNLRASASRAMRSTTLVWMMLCWRLTTYCRVWLNSRAIKSVMISPNTD